MAQNRTSVEIVSRKTGGSILARGAYIHRDQYRDERTGKLTDDNRPDRQDVEFEGLFARDKDDVPEWWYEGRDRIFNELEQREDRSTRPADAQLAYDFKISLPHELNETQRRQLMTDWAREQAGKGWVVDFAIHRPNENNDDRNYHAHVLIPMRTLDREGWGNKITPPEKGKANFYQWAEQNLDGWKQRMSELGARYLERAGHKEEAERFKVGHLSRPERIKASHERGDTEEYNRLMNEPQVYRGAASSAMENTGRQTERGNENRAIDERNKFGGPPRDIREAYALSDTPQNFIKALAERKMIIARVSEADAERQRMEFATQTDNKYVPHYRKGELVIVNEEGSVYRLNRTTTNDSFKNIREFMTPVYQDRYLNMQEAFVEVDRRSRIPDVDRNVTIEKLMNGKPAGERSWLPENADMPQVRGDGLQIWWAYNTTKTPQEFHASLKERGLHTARVTEADVEASKTFNFVAGFQDSYSPVLKKGEYVVLNDKGNAYRLTERILGHERREIKAFMSKLDHEKLPDLRTKVNELQGERQAKIDTRPYKRPVTRVMKQVVRKAARLPGKAMDQVPSTVRTGKRVATGILSLFGTLDPVLTPEQKERAREDAEERREAAKLAEKQRGNYDRER